MTIIISRELFNQIIQILVKTCDEYHYIGKYAYADFPDQSFAEILPNQITLYKSPDCSYTFIKE